MKDLPMVPTWRQDRDSNPPLFHSFIHAISIAQRCTTFLVQGPQFIIFSALEGRIQNYEPNFRVSSINNRICLYLTSLYIACGLIIVVATRAVSDCSELQNC